MAPKRRSNGSAATTPSKKRQRNAVTPKKKAKKAVDFSSVYGAVLKLVLALKDKDDERELAAPFIKLPSKKLYPDYFTIVPNPWTISDIQKKVLKGKYSKTDSSEFLEDFRRISENAALYNDPDSWIVGDSEEILDFVKERIAEGEGDDDEGGDDVDQDDVDDLDNAGDAEGDVEVEKSRKGEAEAKGKGKEKSAPPGPKLSLKLKKPKGRPLNAQRAERAAAAAAATTAALESTEELTLADLPEATTNLIKAVRDHKFPGLGLLSEPFLDDIDRRDYPDYFKIIQHPTSFNRVLSSVKKKGYFNPKKSVEENLSQFHADTLLIFSNAQLYNDPTSLIHQDSVKLQEFFEEKYKLLKERAKPKSAGKLKLKLKQPAPEEKVTLKIERRGRKKKVAVEDVKIEEEGDEEVEDEEEEEEEDSTVAEKDGEDVENDVEEKEKVESKPVLQEEYNSMGKTSSEPNPLETCIQLVSLCSSSNTISTVQQLAQQGLQKQQQQGLQSLGNLTRSKQLKYTLFPAHNPISNAILFEYKFPSRGYANSSYTLSLPHDSASLVSLKISLHKIFYELKKPHLVHGFVNSTNDEDFQCRLFLNDEEVNTGGEIFEGEKEEEKLLNFQYDLKLSQGLNLLTFELKIAPSLSKKMNNGNQTGDQDENSGRHTRHQLQQFKMSWDVEKVNFIICNNVN